MARQLNVQQQNAAVLGAILRVAALCQHSNRLVTWIEEAMRRRGVADASGLLVSFGARPDQGGGDWVHGTWLTSTRRFWEFAAVVPRRDGETIQIERLEDVTEAVVVSAHVPGTGRSFGFVALELLDQQLRSGHTDQ